MIRYILTYALLVTGDNPAISQNPKQHDLDSVLVQVEAMSERFNAIEARLERIENSLEIDTGDTPGILMMRDIDAESLRPYFDELRQWCKQPKLQFRIDKTKNGLIIQGSTTSTAATLAKIQRWINEIGRDKIIKR